MHNLDTRLLRPNGMDGAHRGMFGSRVAVLLCIALMTGEEAARGYQNESSVVADLMHDPRVFLVIIPRS